MGFTDSLPNPIDEIEKRASQFTRGFHDWVEEFLGSAPEPSLVTKVVALIAMIVGGLIFIVPVLELLAFYAAIYYILKIIDILLEAI